MIAMRKAATSESRAHASSQAVLRSLALARTYARDNVMMYVLLVTALLPSSVCTR